MKFIAFLFSFLIISSTQADDASLNFSRELMRYLGIESQVTAEDVAKLAEAKSHAESPELSVDQRKTAYKELFQLTSRLMQSNPPPALYDMLASSAMSWTCSDGGGTPPAYSAKPGEFGDVIKYGSGTIPLILIPDVGMDAHVFQAFLERNKKNYTMYSVTLPGFGGTPALPVFKNRDYNARRLWKNAEDALVNLIKKENIKAPVIIGHQAGAYLSLRMALDHPDMVRGMVVLNGLIYAPMIPSEKDPLGKLTPAFRESIAKVFLPIELFPRPSQECFAKSWQSMGGAMSKNPERSLRLAQNAGKSDPYLTWDYGAELLTTDLSDEIQHLKIPTLVISSIPDPKQLPPSVSQWKAVQLPSVEVVPVENVGTFALDDNPEMIDKLILDFVSSVKMSELLD